MLITGSEMFITSGQCRGDLQLKVGSDKRHRVGTPKVLTEEN